MRRLFFIFMLLCPFLLKAQTITTFAGTGVLGGSGDGGPATAATIGAPDGCAFDASGNFYFTTVGNEKVRKVTPDGIISTIAGTGTAGYNGDGIAATTAELNNVYGIAIDKFNNIFIADAYNHRVRRIDAVTGIITTIAGNGTSGFYGDGGPATASILSYPDQICFDMNGNLLIADFANYRVRKIDTAGIISTIVGNGVYAYSGDGGQATNAAIYEVSGICVDATGNLYLAQFTDYIVRKVDTAGIISTVAGDTVGGNTGDGGPATSASITVMHLAINSSGLYISTYMGNTIRKVNNAGIIHTVVGTGALGYTGDGGPADSARLDETFGVALDSCGNLYVADRDNYCIRRVAFNTYCLAESVENIVATNAVSIYPNPVYDELNISLSPSASPGQARRAGGVRYSVLNMVGSVVMQGELRMGDNIVFVGGMPEGIYMVELTDEDGNKTVKKIIKE